MLRKNLVPFPRVSTPRERVRFVSPVDIKTLTVKDGGSIAKVAVLTCYYNEQLRQENDRLTEVESMFRQGEAGGNGAGGGGAWRARHGSCELQCSF